MPSHLRPAAMRFSVSAVLPSLVCALVVTGCTDAGKEAQSRDSEKAHSTPAASTAATATAFPPEVPAPVLPLPPTERDLLEDGGFEGPGPGAWVENNWPKNQVAFVRDPVNPFKGRFSQRMALIKASGEADLQLFQTIKGAPVAAGVQIRLALRAQSGNTKPLKVQLRRNGAPWTTYSSIQVGATTTWQECVLGGRMPDPLPPDGVGVYVHLQEETVAWVDEVSVSLMPERDPRGPLPGDLIANGSFEAGMHRWYIYNRNGGSRPPVGSTEDLELGAPDGGVFELADAAQGRRALRLDTRKHCATYLNSAAFPYHHGHPLTVSAQVRARPASGKPGAKLGFDLMVGPNGSAAWMGQKGFQVGAEWTPVTFTCTPGPSAAGAFLQLYSHHHGIIEMDDVRVTQVAGAIPVPVFGIEQADMPPAAVYRGDERPRAVVRAASLPAGATVEAGLRVVDAWGTTLSYLPVALAADAQGYATALVPLPTARFGGFRCALEIQGRLEAETIYCVVPTLPKPDGSGRSFFGGHFGFSEYGLVIAERAGMRWGRLHPPSYTKWSEVEREPGKLAFCTSGVERAQAHGFNLLGLFDSTPKWAGIVNGMGPAHCARLPRDWSEYANYVQATRRAFPGIRHWEVWNEPDGEYFLSLPQGKDRAQAYVEIMTNTRTAIDKLAATDPQLAQVELVGLAVASLDLPVARKVIELDGARQVDSLSFHLYGEDQDPLEKQVPFLPQLAWLRAARNRSGGEPAIWHTEGGMWIQTAPTWLALCGYRSTECSTQLDGAHALVRIATTLKALGVKRHFHYGMMGNGNLMWRNECAGMIDFGGFARPALAAHAAMVQELDDAEPLSMDVIAVEGAKVRLARFASPRGPLTVAWVRGDLPAGKVPGLLDGAARITDLMGNPVAAGAARVTLAPLYVRGR